MKTKRIIHTTSLLFSLLVLLSCNLLSLSIIQERGSGNIVQDPRSVSGFQQVTLSGSGDVILTQGDVEKLVVETDDNLMEYIKTDVQGENLILGFNEAARNKNIQPSQGIKFYLTVIDVDALKISGSGTITTKSLQVETLDLKISGSGDITIDSLNALSLDGVISGSGDVQLAGSVSDLNLTVSGSGKFQSPNLESRTAVVKISGSGDATIWVLEQLDVTISGSGDVSYFGKPTISSSQPGSGNLTPLGDK